MGRVIYTLEETLGILQEVEQLRKQGKTLTESIRLVGVTEQTYYRWRKLYGTIGLKEIRRISDLERENTQLKRVVSNLSIDNAYLKNMAEISGKF